MSTIYFTTKDGTRLPLKCDTVQERAVASAKVCATVLWPSARVLTANRAADGKVSER
jgi:hypothetical protein